MTRTARLPLLAALAAAAGGLFSPPARSQNAADVRTTEGMIVAVPSPVTSEGVQRIKNQVEARVNNPARPVKTVVFEFTPGGKDAANTSFGACYELMQVIDRFKAGTTTVAFVTGKATGHTVLPVLACRELVMARGATLGPVAADGVAALGPAELAAYDAITKDRKLPAAVVRKFFDKDVRLVRAQARPGVEPGGVQYVDANNKADMARVVGGGEAVEFAPDGQVAAYSADQARQLGLAAGVLDTRADVAEAYNLPPGVVVETTLDRAPDAYKFTLAGDVDGGTREAVGRIVRDVKRKKGNVLFLTLAATGGDLSAARGLADDLRDAAQGEDGVLVVGFIPDSAPDAAAFVALGCGDVVMSKRADATDPGTEPGEATLGDFSASMKANKAGTLEAHRKSLRDLAEKRNIPPILIDGLFDRDLEIVQAQNTAKRSQRRLMSRAEADAEKDKWTVTRTVKPAGQYLKLTASLAEELGVARFTVDGRDPAAVYGLYGVAPDKVKDVSAHWVDKFAEFLRNPAVTVILIVVGFTGLILELKVPGLTVPGIVAALCFILVFWSQSRFSGEMFVLALLLFLLGLALLGLEIFVLPGFGAPGIVGILCMLAGLGLLTFEKVPDTADQWGMLGYRMVTYFGGVMGSVALAFVIARFLPNVPYANRMVLMAPGDGPNTAALPGVAEAAALMGAIGTANTPLRPAGVVRFADRFVDVVSDGGFIGAGARVQVVAVEGTRIVVKEV
ncbi:MAG: NfeD family protein [Gemmataceae bacterium]